MGVWSGGKGVGLVKGWDQVGHTTPDHILEEKNNNLKKKNRDFRGENEDFGVGNEDLGAWSGA